MRRPDNFTVTLVGDRSPGRRYQVPGPNCIGLERNKTFEGFRYLTEAIDHFAAVVPTDRNRWVLTGYSQGGGIVFSYALRTPDLWAAVYPGGLRCSHHWFNECEANIDAKKFPVPWYNCGTPLGAGLGGNVSCVPFIFSDGHGDNPRFNQKPAVDELKANRADSDRDAPLLMHVNPGVGHAWPDPFQTRDLDWMGRQVRRRPARFAYVADTPFRLGAWGVMMNPNPKLACDKPATWPRLTCEIDGRRVALTTKNMDGLTVVLGKAPDGLSLGLTGQVAVVWNGKQAYRGPATKITLGSIHVAKPKPVSTTKRQKLPPRPAPTKSDAASTKRRCRVYHIGNSVTDTIGYEQLKAMSAAAGSQYVYGRHMIPGAPLQWVWQHPDDGFRTEPYGHYPRALTKFTWDAITLQPLDRQLDRGDPGDDRRMIANFINKALENSENAKAVFYILSRWPRRDRNGDKRPDEDFDFSRVWNQEYTDKLDNTNETRDYFQQVIETTRKDYPGQEIRMIPVGDVLAELDRRIKSGRFESLRDVEDLYRDNIHFTNRGKFVVGAVCYATLFGANPTRLVGDAYGVTDAKFVSEVSEVVWDGRPDHARVDVPALDQPVILADHFDVDRANDVVLDRVERRRRIDQRRPFAEVTADKEEHEAAVSRLARETGEVSGQGHHDRTAGRVVVGPAVVVRHDDNRLVVFSRQRPDDVVRGGPRAVEGASLAARLPLRAGGHHGRPQRPVLQKTSQQPPALRTDRKARHQGGLVPRTVVEEAVVVAGAGQDRHATDGFLYTDMAQSRQVSQRSANAQEANMLSDTFRCYLVRKTGKDRIEAAVDRRPLRELPHGEVLIETAYSSVYYKDALAARGHPGVAQKFPHVRVCGSPGW